ncbi:lipocalin-like domain-containing protein [Streptomyces platensis]|uniref:lipocalin-like domain-containing protein n=1 Tax=Streptomyces platensis TaxID=58346 RepID=UPI001F2E3FE0|nr:lipocalin-like domain-containing protein [Streptomyces platensis]MCF3145197.1 lipocalin-like domain-containing protein [Streptomyces platensis]
MTPDDLIGAWSLVSFHEIDPMGERSEGPLGPDPLGQLLYTADGRVSVHMMRPDSGGAAASYMGYGGSWWLSGNQVVHRIEFTPRADWIGTEQDRQAELDGDRLTLYASTRILQFLHRRVLVWQRLP